MAASPGELALDLSQLSVQAQEQNENQLREKATAVLAAASVVVPVAALALGTGRRASRSPSVEGYEHNQSILEDAADRRGRAIVMLTLELLALVVALVITLVH